MFGLSPKLPITDEERQGVDEGFRRLEKLVGRRRMIDAQIILPTPEYFPDPYDKTPACAELLFQRVCGYMRVDRHRIELHIFPDETDELRSILPYWRGNSGGCAGFYSHDPSGDSDNAEDDPRMLVALRSTQLREPISLVATMAHELGHVILLGGGLMTSKTSDHEPMTDFSRSFSGWHL